MTTSFHINLFLVNRKHRKHLILQKTAYRNKLTAPELRPGTQQKKTVSLLSLQKPYLLWNHAPEEISDTTFSVKEKAWQLIQKQFLAADLFSQHSCPSSEQIPLIAHREYEIFGS